MIGKICGRRDYFRHFYADGRPKIVVWNPDVQEPSRSAFLAICHICDKPRADWLCRGDLGGGNECGLVICQEHAGWRTTNGQTIEQCPRCISLHDYDHRRLMENEEAEKCPVCGISKKSLFK